MSLNFKKKMPQCERGCQLVTIETVDLDELTEIIEMKNNTFCLSYFCDDRHYDWILHLDMCICHNDQEQLNKEKENQSLSSCCEKNSYLINETGMCELGKEDVDRFEDCGYKRLRPKFKSFEEKTFEEYKCSDAMMGTEIGGIVCEPACNGMAKCVRYVFISIL